MRMETSLQARMLQEMRLAPQMIQSMEILQMPLLELQKRVAQELEENPVLEVKSFETDEAGKAAVEKEKAAEDFAKLEEWSGNVLEHMRQVGGRRAAPEDRDAKQEMLENAPSDASTLQDVLVEQMNLLSLTERQKAIGLEIVYNLDEGGYLRFPLDRIAEAMEPPAPVEEVEQVLRRIQRFDPPGVASRDLRECLLLQLDGKFGSDRDLVRELITNHLPDLQNNRFPRVAQRTGHDIETIKGAVAEIGTLQPRPGAAFGARASRYILPDVVVAEVDGQYEIRLENSVIPQVFISPVYQKQLEAAREKPELLAYLRKKMEAAKWMIDAIHQRQDTLSRIAHTLFDFQKDFLEKGVDGLVPLKMQEVADKVRVHVSTVSRAISGKHVQTPRGIFPMKFFFSGGTKSVDGSEESWVRVRQAVQEMVAKEDKKNPLSDGEIEARLKSQGLDIARRTVTKYRKQLKIPSSRRRKLF
ncbi:MAG: RNA polymerase factor sigma-54 [Planctomycetes bacterium]|nr:RNA polymerase factor sigma-54 [Planctomycetota bacterium]